MTCPKMKAVRERGEIRLFLALSSSNASGIQHSHSVVVTLPTKAVRYGGCHVSEREGFDTTSPVWPQIAPLTCELSQRDPINHGSSLLRVTPVNSAHVSHDHCGVHSVHPNLGPRATVSLTRLL